MELGGIIGVHKRQWIDGRGTIGAGRWGDCRGGDTESHAVHPQDSWIAGGCFIGSHITGEGIYQRPCPGSVLGGYVHRIGRSRASHRVELGGGQGGEQNSANREIDLVVHQRLAEVTIEDKLHLSDGAGGIGE